MTGNAFKLAILFIFVSVGRLKAQSAGGLINQPVNLKGKSGVTIIKNATADTLKLTGVFFNYLPYVENNFSIKLPPGKQDSLIFQFNYPDFILVNNSFRILNAPGGRVIATINNIKPKVTDITFTGDLQAENTYYLTYNNFPGNFDQESRPFYSIGDGLKNFNLFPVKADSITQARLNFLANYSHPLSPAFKQHEQQRLQYNNIMRKYNVLASKIFYGAKPVPVNAGYYSFEKDFNLNNEEGNITADYLFATEFYLFKKSKNIQKVNQDPVIYVTDSLAGNAPVGDLLKLQRLSKLYTISKPKYDSVFATVHFYNPETKLLTDSLIQTKLGFPKVGNNAPDMVLKDLSGKVISLHDYKGHPVIINFWAVWCGPCIAEFPSENKLYNEYKDKGLMVINVCADSDIEQWKAVSKRDNLQMINLFADSVSYAGIKRKYNVGALPRSILIKKDFRVADNYYTRASMINAKALEAFLNN